MKRNRDSRVVNAVFDLWLGRDMFFNNPPGQNIKQYRSHTKVKKLKYTGKIQKYMDRMEELEYMKFGVWRDAVAIDLDGITRYVWREDLLTEKEYVERIKEQKNKLGVLFKKSNRNVGES